MSVINTMLHNLDERRASEAEKVILPGEVVALPRARRRGPGKLFVIVLLLGVIAFSLLYFWPHPQMGRTPQPAVIEPVTPLAGTGESPVLADAGAVQAAVSAPAAVLEANSVGSLPIAQESRVMPEARKPLRGPERSTDDSLRLATSMGNARTAPRTATPPAAEQPASRRGSVPPPAQSLPTMTVPVAVVSPSVASTSIRVEQSAQTAQERNLSDIQRALELQKRGALAEAEGILRGVLENDKRMVMARTSLLTQLLRQQRTDEAQHLLREGLDFTPTEPQLLLPYVRLLAARNEWSAANDALVPAADALAQDPQYRALNGTVLQRLGRYAQSSTEYRAALRLVPAAGTWWVGLGLSLEGEGKQIEARSAYLQARNLTLGPDLAQFVENKLGRLAPVDQGGMP